MERAEKGRFATACVTLCESILRGLDGEFTFGAKLTELILLSAFDVSMVVDWGTFSPTRGLRLKLERMADL